jgi:hypothetical protein
MEHTRLPWHQYNNYSNQKINFAAQWQVFLAKLYSQDLLSACSYPNLLQAANAA